MKGPGLENTSFMEEMAGINKIKTRRALEELEGTSIPTGWKAWMDGKYYISGESLENINIL